MKAESDFYNVISAVEARGFCVDTMMAVQIIWTQLKYNQAYCDETRGFESELVRAQMNEIYAAKSLTTDEKSKRIALVNLRY